MLKDTITSRLFGAMQKNAIGDRLMRRIRGWLFVNAWGRANTQNIRRAASLEGRIGVKNGTANHLEIGEGARFSGTIQVEGNSNRIVIGRDAHFRGDILVKGDGQTVSFGDQSTTISAYILCQEGCEVQIGAWCMLSRNVEIRTTDAHSVIDRATGKRINPAAGVRIGDHVWIGAHSTISKGAKIPSDSIVGAMSFVNGEFDEEGVVIAGIPARITKRGITWNRGRKGKYDKKQLDHWRTQISTSEAP